MSSVPTSSSGTQPGIQAQDWDSASGGWFGRDTATIKVPVKISLGENEAKTIYLTFSGTKKELDHLNSNSKFRSAVERTVAVALKKGLLTPDTTPEELLPIAFSAEDLKKGSFTLAITDDAAPGTTKDQQKATDYINAKINSTSHYDADSLKNYLLGRLPSKPLFQSSQNSDRQNTFHRLSDPVQQIVTKRIEEAYKKAESTYKSASKITRIASVLGLGKPETSSLRENLPPSKTPFDPKEIDNATAIFEKKEGTYYDKNELEAAPAEMNLEKVGSEGSDSNKDYKLLESNWSRLNHTQQNLDKTHDKNERYAENLSLLAAQHDTHAAGCRKLAAKIKNSEPEAAKTLINKAIEAETAAHDLRRDAAIKFAELTEALKQKGIQEGKPPYEKPADFDQALLNAQVLQATSNVPDIGWVEGSYKDIAKYTDTKKARDLKAKVDAHKTSLSKALDDLEKQLAFCRPSEKKEAETLFTALATRLESFDKASIQLEGLAGYRATSLKKNFMSDLDGRFKAVTQRNPTASTSPTDEQIGKLPAQTAAQAARKAFLELQLKMTPVASPPASESASAAVSSSPFAEITAKLEEAKTDSSGMTFHQLIMDLRAKREYVESKGAAAPNGLANKLTQQRNSVKDTLLELAVAPSKQQALNLYALAEEYEAVKDTNTAATLKSKALEYLQVLDKKIAELKPSNPLEKLKLHAEKYNRLQLPTFEADEISKIKAKFQELQSTPNNEDPDRAALAGAQKQILKQLDKLIENNKESTELPELKAELDAQYKTLLGTLLTPPTDKGKIIDLPEWLKARSNAIRTPLNSGAETYERRLYAMKLQPEMLELYKEIEWLPPHFAGTIENPSLELDKNAEKLAKQLQEIAADLRAKKQFLSSITHKEDPNFKPCRKLFNKQSEALIAACKAVKIKPPPGTSPAPSPIGPPLPDKSYLNKIILRLQEWIEDISTPLDLFPE